MSAVDRATGVAFPDRIRLLDDPMTREEAEHVTEQINTHAVRLVQVVVEAKRGSAHLALGFDTWNEYCDRRLRISRQYAAALIRYSDKLEELSEWTGIPSDLFELTERGTRALTAETMVSTGTTAVAELGDGADEVEKAAAASAAIKAAAKAQNTASQAVTAAARRRCVEHLTADPGLSVRELAKAAGAPPEMAQDVWDELEALRIAHDSSDQQPPAGADAPEPVPAPVPGDDSDASSSASDQPQQDPPPAAAKSPGEAGTAQPTDAAAPGESTGVEAGAGASGGQAASTAPPAATLPDDWRNDLANAAYLLRHPVACLADALGPDDAHDLRALQAHLTETLDIYESIQATKEQA